MTENNTVLTDKTEKVLNKAVENTFPMLDDDLEEKIREKSTDVLENIYENNSYHGKKSENLVGAVVYVESNNFLPVQPEEVADSLGISKKDLFGTVRYLMKNGYVEANLGATPSDYVRKFSKELELDDDLEKEALEISMKTEENGRFSGRAPSGLGASSIYLASSLNGGNVTQKDLSKVCGKSEVTIRKNYKSQKSELINSE